jgi:glycosyltransferase involved in cell wall biosynthesis
MTTPLVSIIIPTFGRPQYLSRAVSSALSCQGSNVEIVVVPNGPDESWKKVMSRWSDDERVHISPIASAHANAARNHGMDQASGKYLRFLDDDDYLLPSAIKQLELIEFSGADICSGLLANIDQSGVTLGEVGFPSTRDFLCAAASISGFTLPTGNLFDRKALAGRRWDVNVHRAQDYAWMIDLAAESELRWIHLDEQVGVWFQHNLPRTSSTKRLTSREEIIVQRLLGLHRRLVYQKRNNMERDKAIADGLWYYIHRGFPSHPLYWTRIAMLASSICPHARPHPRYLRRGILTSVPPLISEWAILPPRLLSQGLSAIREARGRHEYRRIL